MVKFEFIGFSYQPRARKSQSVGKIFMAFTAEISPSNRKRIGEVIRESSFWNNTTLEMSAISDRLNSKLRGWINYYGKYSTRTLRRTRMKIDERLIKWIKRKHKIGYRKAAEKLRRIRQDNPALFYHWQRDTESFIKNNKSRMTGDCHVQFCERLRGETPPCLFGG